jgi:hypothetical protein
MSPEHVMTPEFYLILRYPELEDQLVDADYEAGFDDSSLVIRGDNVAIWVTSREGELTELVRAALDQASRGKLDVLHVEIMPEIFASVK